MPIRVLLADDSKIMRTSIANLLKADPEIELIGEADSFTNAPKLVAETQPQVVVMDLHMRDERQVSPSDFAVCLNGSRILAISLWNDDETKALATMLGAVRLLDKATLSEKLIPAIRQLADDEAVEAAHG